MSLQTVPNNDEVSNPKRRILLVDDDNELLTITQRLLEKLGFDIVSANNVSDALRLIADQTFDVLLSDLHMPNAGDGFTVVSAMRHTQPKAITIVLSGYPAIQEAVDALAKHADEVLLKPIKASALAEIINKRLASPGRQIMLSKERVSKILERDGPLTIQDWMSRCTSDEELEAMPLNPQERTGHLPRLMADLVLRLRSTSSSKALVSLAAREHGALRRVQGYTIPMMVEESRILQVSIFNTLQKSLGSVDFDTVLLDVMTIADEVDSQLKQAVLGFMESPVPNPV
jgi:CheY-like chemotaxis protein